MGSKVQPDVRGSLHLSAGNSVFSTTEREMFVDVIFVELGPPEDPPGKPGGLCEIFISGQFSGAAACC